MAPMSWPSGREIERITMIAASKPRTTNTSDCVTRAKTSVLKPEMRASSRLAITSSSFGINAAAVSATSGAAARTAAGSRAAAAPRNVSTRAAKSFTSAPSAAATAPLSLIAFS